QTRPKPEHRRRAATLASRRKTPAPQPPTAQPSGHIFCVCAILPPFKTVAQSISESQWLIRLGRVIFGSILKAVSASSGSRSISSGLLRLGPGRAISQAAVRPAWDRDQAAALQAVIDRDQIERGHRG